MTTLLTRYAALFTAARNRRMKIKNEDGGLSDYSLVCQRIERKLTAGTATEDDIAELGRIAQLFREQKARQAA